MYPHVAHTESKPKRTAAVESILAGLPASTPKDANETLKQDLDFANSLVAQAVTSSSWNRNASWVSKFKKYVLSNCPVHLRSRGINEALASDRLAVAFLAKIARETPNQHTRVGAAKRAINLLRAFIGAESLDHNITVRMMVRGARSSVVRTVAQSPAILAAFVASIVASWGNDPVWWKRQIAFMILLMFCTLGRGGEVVACLRTGFSWVLQNGLLPLDADNFVPGHQCTDSSCSRPNCVRGFLILFPSRKNRRNSPTWLPVAERSAVRLFARHIRWLGTLPAGDTMFPARIRQRGRGRNNITFSPNHASAMSSATFLTLLRKALVECCGLTPSQAAMYGKHGGRVGGLEELRRCGAPEELRQQVGDWMSREVALSYLQLNPGAQFDVLARI